MYPGWSARDNYAVHKKRRKRKTKQIDSKQSPSATTTGAIEEQDTHNTNVDAGSNNDIDGR